MNVLHVVRLGLCVCAILLSGIGCAMSGNYQTARTLEKGTSDVGLTFGIDNLFTDTAKGVVLPGLIPEVTFHTGLTDDIELGGRVALGALGIEGDVKYRFYHNDKLHLAVNPAFGYQAFILAQGISARLPFLATYEVSKSFSLNAVVFGNYGNLASSLISGKDSTLEQTIYTGLSIGPEFRGEVFYIRPAIEYSRVFSFVNSQVNQSNRINFNIHFGWIMGQEKKQLNRIENKMEKLDNLDRLEKKIDKINERDNNKNSSQPPQSINAGADTTQQTSKNSTLQK